MLTALVAVVSVLTSSGQASAPPAEHVVSGVVREQGTGGPISGAQVTMMRERSGPPPSGMAFERPPQTTTDSAGRFVFRGVAPGRYRFSAQKAGFAMPFGPAAMPVAVDVAANVDSVELALPRGGVLTGRVLDAGGEPVANAMVSVMRPRPEFSASAGAPPRPPLPRLVMAGPAGQTNELGEFRVHSLAAGEYVVRAMARASGPSGMAPDGQATTWVPTYAPGTTDADAADSVVVQAGGTTHVGDIRMVSASAFRVTGTVVDAGGRPVAGALIRLAAADPAADMLPMAGPMGANRTDERGAFTLDGVVAGAYTLTAIAPVVIARTRSSANGSASVSGEVVMTGGSSTGMVTTETRDGTTVQFRDDAGTRVAVTIAGEHVTGLQVVVRR